MWVRKNFGRGEIVDLCKCKVIRPVVDDVCRTDEAGRETFKTAYFIYADDIAIFRSYDKEEAQATYDALIGKLDTHSMSAIAENARRKYTGGNK